jgi:predicted site-specific integrase-resolvase
MKLSEYARKLGLSYTSVYSHYKHGLIPGAYQLPSGTIIVPNEIFGKLEDNHPDSVAIYARVSSNTQKDDLDKQEERLKNFAAAKGYKIYKSVKEIASGLNENRPKLKQLIEDKNYSLLLVEHKDRLTRFGFNYIQLIFNEQKRNIEIINDTEENNDLLQDFTDIVTSFCARIYGQRRGKRKTEKITKELMKENYETME